VPWWNLTIYLVSVVAQSLAGSSSVPVLDEIFGNIRKNNDKKFLGLAPMLLPLICPHAAQIRVFR